MDLTTIIELSLAVVASTVAVLGADVQSACEATIRVASTIEPLHAVSMNKAYARYRRVYPALREIGRA